MAELPRRSYGPHCAICEMPLDPYDRQTIRLSSSQPPWRPRAALGVIGAMAKSFAEVLRAATAEPEVTLWFHRACWRKFHELLGGLDG
jgi:hypothetical protein